MSARYGSKISPLVSRKSNFFKKNRFDNLNITLPPRTESNDSASEWERPSDWLEMPTITSDEEKIAILMPVFPQGSNFLAFAVEANYTVDWGDGIIENFGSGTKAQHEYSYTDSDLDTTVTSDGYKMAIVIITPQLGENITAVSFNQKYALTGSVFPNTSPILEIILSCPNMTTFLLGASSDALSFCKNLVHFSGVNMNSLYNWSTLFGFCISLKKVDFEIINPYELISTFLGCRCLETVPLFDTQNVINMSNMFQNCTSLKKVPLFNTSQVSSMSSMFAVCSSLQEVPLFDTANVTNMSAMFLSCSILNTIPLFNTVKLGNASSMFSGCSILSKIPLFNTSKVIDMSSMFSNCASLTTVPLFDTQNVVSMPNMFQSCQSLIEIPLFNTAKVSSMSNMFSSCTSLITVPLFNTTNVSNMSTMFSSCISLKKIPTFNVPSLNGLISMFQGCTSLKTIPMLNTRFVSDFTNLFQGCRSLETIPLLNTTNAINMSSMFSNCSSLIEVPLLNTQNVTNMSTMFSGCGSLKTVPLFNTTKVTSISGMFSSCVSLTTVPLFDTQNVNFINSMFSGCVSLKTVPLFNTTKVTNMSGMFSNCISLEAVPLLDTQNVTNMSSMFFSCLSLVTVPLFNTAKVTNMGFMFDSCNTLITVPFLNAAASTTFGFTFSTCLSLTSGSLNGPRFSLSYSGCKISPQELESIFNNLGTIGAASQVVTITNNWGTGILFTKTGSTTLGGTTINISDTSNISIGMQVTGNGSPLTTARTGITFTAAGNLVNLANHGLLDGDEISFSVITSTTGIIINRIYYVINSLTNTFQISDTVGGPAIALTNGSGSMRYRTEVVSIIPNTSVTVSRRMTATGSNSLVFRTLKTGTALLKGWAVTG
jgi:surface protein